LGTGFVVKKHVKHLITGYQGLTPRIYTLRLKGKFFNYPLINAHSPTAVSEIEEKEEFYETLERAYDPMTLKLY
jgi:hypothetical protein